MMEGDKRVFPKSSIKRLRFAFAAMAGLTVLALIIGCITFAFSHVAQKQFLDETAPLLVDIEQLSKVAVGFSSASKQLETISTRRHLGRAMKRYRSRSDQIQAALLNLEGHSLKAQTVIDLHQVVRELEEHEQIYAATLDDKIDAITRLDTLRSEIGDEGQDVQDWLRPLTLDSSLRLIQLAQDDSNSAVMDQDLNQVLNEVQLLTDLSFAMERFLHATDNSDANAASREAIAPEFRGLAQLAVKLQDQGKREAIAGFLQTFNEKALGESGIAEQSKRLGKVVSLLEVLDQQRTVLLTRMTDLIDRIVVDARARFFNDAETAQTRSLLAVLALVLFSMIAFVAMIWIGSRLINKGIAQRLDRLATSTVALASGDLDVAIDQSGSDELADMARATEIFRRNARDLRQTEAELADRLLEVEGANEKLVDVNRALDHANAELAESELRYELAINGSSVGIWDWDVQTDTLFWSNRLKQMVGLTDQTFEPDLSWFADRLHPDDRALVMDQRRRHLEDGQDYDVECRLRLGDGSYIWIQNRGQAVWDSDGQPKRMAGSADDITDRKLAQIELASYANELERSNRELDDFAYIASHDLKEPLRAIFNHASFLLEDYQETLEEDGQKRLHRMIKLSKRMEQLIADLLYFSRLGRGDQATEVLDLDKVITGIESSLAETLKSQNARIEISEALPSVSGHPAHISALFRNLISNSVKYNDAAEKFIQIGVVPSNQDADARSHCTLFIRDNGIGIDERFQTDIFRIFKRLNSEKAYGEGTGAGLTFAKKIVENHGGSIWLESALGKGTTFFFTLKRAT